VAAVPVRAFEFTSAPGRASIGAAVGVPEFRGVVARPYAAGEDAEFFVLRGLLAENEVAEVVATGSKVLGDLIGGGGAREPDPVDGRPAFAVDLAPRGAYGAELANVLRPVVEGRLLPYLRQKYSCPEVALAAALFRRYVPEERRYVPPHHDYHAFVTAVLSFQAADAYIGGLFVQGSGRAFIDRRFLELGRGDVVVHQSDLHQGVEVQEGSHFSVVLYFKDSFRSVADDSALWYRRSAAAGDATSQYGLALSLERVGDSRGAQTWLEKACAQDQPEALFTYANMTLREPDSKSGSGREPDASRALQLYRRAAELGHGASQSRLGSILISGIKGRVQQDSWEAKRLLRLAFEQDDADAGFHLGSALLQEGDRDGVTKLLASAAKGHPSACFHIGLMYREGQYQLPKDLFQSLRYTKWSAHQGEPQALSNLGHMVMTGMGVLKDEAKAARLFRLAARANAPEGQLNWGLCLLRGNGGTRVDYQEALEWAQKSAAQGHQMAQEMLPTFFNAARNPNPPSRSQPASIEDLRCLSVKQLRDLLHSNGEDFSDCVEKVDLVNRAAARLPGAAVPWDPAPEHPIIPESPKRRQAARTVAPEREKQESGSAESAPAPLPTASSPATARPTSPTTNPTASADPLPPRGTPGLQTPVTSPAAPPSTSPAPSATAPLTSPSWPSSATMPSAHAQSKPLGDPVPGISPARATHPMPPRPATFEYVD